ncbi:hypothetical protein GCM10012275_32820 [Longimycelium tulufanense]|uniref:Uncharacterized protein n=1 Tax=Longimycelium tulufanense TaxID=907463 RepID=A0A8J3FUZ0_9PSEU|nr:hypothetical protein [Longimycelium tulufanense]GGM59099.1 hypothetical protein GCM10012275_32820 [Longimycelium tulufanense]
MYELLDATNQTITAVAARQRRHDTRLEEIQHALDLAVGRLDRLEQAEWRLAETQREQAAKLDEILDLLRNGRG